MKALYLSMVIGLAAGSVDILPMLMQRMDRRAIFSAFLQYFFLSIIIVNIDLPGIAWWLEGGMISLAMAIPIIIIVSAVDKKAAPAIATMSILLGTLISVAGHYLV